MFREMLYSVEPSSDSRKILSAIYRLRLHLKKKRVYLSKGWDGFTHLSILEKFGRAKFSLSKSKQVIMDVMLYDQLQRGLNELQQDGMIVPEALKIVGGLATLLGFKNANEMIAYVKSPASTPQVDLNIDAEIETRKQSILEGAALIDQDIMIAREFSSKLLESLKQNTHQDFIRSIIVSFNIELPIVNEFDFDEDMVDYTPPDIGDPPDTTGISKELDELGALQAEVESGNKDKVEELRNKFGEVYMHSHEFIKQLHNYFSIVCDHAAKKRKIEIYPHKDYLAWKQQTIETLDQGFEAVAIALNSIKPQLIQLGVACGIAARSEVILEDVHNVFNMFFRQFNSDDIAALWTQTITMASQKGALKNIIPMFYSQLMSS